MRLCPRLMSLRIDCALRPAPRGAAAPAHDVRGLRELTLAQRGADGMRLFASDAVPHVHLRAAAPYAAGVLASEVLNSAVHLFFSRTPAGVVVLRDRDRRTRTFSELDASTFDYLLRKAWAVSKQLTSLCVPDCLAARDAEALSNLAFPELRVFSVFVRGTPGAGTHIFDIYGETRRAWTFPALEDIRFATTSPVRDPDLFHDVSHTTRPELSAAALLQFYIDMITRGVKRRPSLTMVGVGFSERFAGPEVSALRTTFSAVQFIC